MSEAGARAAFDAAVDGVAAPAWLPTSAVRHGSRRLRRRAAGRVSLVLACGITMVTGVVSTRVGRPSSGPLAVACDGARMSLEGRAEASPAGVRVRATNETGEIVHLSFGGVGTYLVPGLSTVHLPVPPGVASVRCTSATGVTHSGELTVHDPSSVYVPASVSCRNPRHRVRASDAVIHTGDPLELTREKLAELVPSGATVEPAGYPLHPARAVRVRHGVNLLAVVRWHALPGETAWLLDSETVCPAV